MEFQCSRKIGRIRRQADEREAHCRQTEQKVQRKTQGPGTGSSV